MDTPPELMQVIVDFLKLVWEMITRIFAYGTQNGVEGGVIAFIGGIALTRFAGILLGSRGGWYSTGSPDITGRIPAEYREPVEGKAKTWIGRTFAKCCMLTGLVAVFSGVIGVAVNL